MPNLVWSNLFYLTCKELDKQNDALETYWKLDLENKLLINEKAKLKNNEIVGTINSDFRITNIENNILSAFRNTITAGYITFELDLDTLNMTLRGSPIVIRSCKSNIDISIQSNNKKDEFEGAKRECLDLGIEPNTERFGDCILQLTK